MHHCAILWLIGCTFMCIVRCTAFGRSSSLVCTLLINASSTVMDVCDVWYKLWSLHYDSKNRLLLFFAVEISMRAYLNFYRALGLPNTSKWTHTYIQTHTHIFIHTHIHTHPHTHTHTHTHIHSHIYRHIYRHIHTDPPFPHTHTLIHTPYPSHKYHHHSRRTQPTPMHPKVSISLYQILHSVPLFDTWEYLRFQFPVQFNPQVSGIFDQFGPETSVFFIFGYKTRKFRRLKPRNVRRKRKERNRKHFIRASSSRV